MNAGFFRYSRPPNWFCGQGMWWVFYLFAVTASGQSVHWTGLGFVVLSAVFAGSVQRPLVIRRLPRYRTALWVLESQKPKVEVVNIGV